MILLHFYFHLFANCKTILTLQHLQIADIFYGRLHTWSLDQTICKPPSYVQWFSPFSYAVMVQEDLNVRRVCSVITQKAGPLFLPSRLFQLPQVHSRQVCLYTYICSQIHTWAYLTINWMGVLFVGTNELHLLSK